MQTSGKALVAFRKIRPTLRTPCRTTRLSRAPYDNEGKKERNGSREEMYSSGASAYKTRTIYLCPSKASSTACTHVTSAFRPGCTRERDPSRRTLSLSLLSIRSGRALQTTTTTVTLSGSQGAGPPRARAIRGPFSRDLQAD